MSIEVFCHTNIDEYAREEWPSKFTCPPIVGDYVQSKSRRTLKICRITHSLSYCYDSRSEGDGKRAFLDIELHK